MDPEIALLIFLIGGTLAVASWVAYQFAESLGSRYSLLPPLPRFA